MRRPRAISLRTLLALVAASAAIFGWVRYELTKPHPIAVVREGRIPPVVLWSDRKSHRDDRGRGNYPVAVESGRLVSKVRWSDGKVTRYLTGPER